MPTTSQKNTALAPLLWGLSIALVLGWLATAAYIHAHSDRTGKGALGAVFESLTYGLAVCLALAEAAFLRSAWVGYRVVFYVSALAAVLFIAAVFYFGEFDARPLEWPLSYLQLFPFLCIIALLIVPFAKR